MTSQKGAGVDYRSILLLVVISVGLLVAASTAREVPAVATGGLYEPVKVSVQHDVPSGQNPIGNQVPPPYDVVKTKAAVVDPSYEGA
ncbi:hypothetical protein ACP70R_035230 [Stipagrostis hirtigluma subsp. patula]